jgi:hypothetical protein
VGSTCRVEKPFVLEDRFTHINGDSFHNSVAFIPLHTREETGVDPENFNP